MAQTTKTICRSYTLGPCNFFSAAQRSNFVSGGGGRNYQAMSSKHRTSLGTKDQTRLRIERMEAEREERRRAMVTLKQERAREERRNIAAGNPGDVDFIGMVRSWRDDHAQERQSYSAEHPRICIVVRKRPISDKERAKNDHDSVTCINPAVWIHSAKLRVDGITKYLDHTCFEFDHSFDESATNEDVYSLTAMPLLDFCCAGKGGRATVFAYGQTGSGKTHTCQGIQELLCHDLFLLLTESSLDEACSLAETAVMVSFFELYGGYIQDLLNNSKRLKVLEDGKGEIVVVGLNEVEATDVDALKTVLESGNSARTTHTTEANDTSSRSHAICQITLRDRKSNALRGRLSLVDLAGSERGTDTKSHNSQRRAESSDINTSLLALKECVRALDRNKQGGSQHVPYRASKLTLILKDCFTSDRAMTTMIATVSPGASAADHSLNTLRYADRIKEKRIPGRIIRTTTTNQSSAAAALRKQRSTALALKSQLAQPEITAAVALAHVSPSGQLEDELWSETRPVIDGLKSAAEDILNQHMENIQENAELLSTEGQLLQQVQGENITDEQLDEYVSALEAILERKEDMILGLQDMIAILQDK